MSQRNITTTKLVTDWQKLGKILDAPAGPALDSIPDILSSPADANHAIGCSLVIFAVN
jgi:hypothetical protein